MKDEWIGLDGIALGELVRRKEVQATELTEAAIRRVESVNPKLNAVIHKMYDAAREAARAWDTAVMQGKAGNAVFCGVPFLLKDLFAEYKGAPFNEGCAAVKGYISKIDTELVKRQKAAGLVVLGKTNTPEFGILPATEPHLYGPTRNPWDPALTPGGSSGGSAAAVAAGVVPMAHGNDGGGSIRIPASCCGLFGLKPTRARNPLGPIFGDSPGGIAAEHAITRSVRDSAALLDATSGPETGDPYCAPQKERPFLQEVGREPGRLKIGLLTRVPEGWHDVAEVHPDCLAAANDAARLCADLGHTVEEVPASALSHPKIGVLFGQLFASFVGWAIAYWERELQKKITRDQLEPITWDSYQSSLKRTAVDHLVIVEEIQRFSRKIAEWYERERYDLLLSPTMTVPPLKTGSFQALPENPRKWLDAALAFVAFTRVQNMTGQPAMSVPLFWTAESLPIGVQFAARFGEEGLLFRLAGQLEKARPWRERKPPIHCERE